MPERAVRFQASEPSAFYQNPTYGVSLNYPSNWERQEGADTHSFMVRFISPGDPNGFRESVTFMIEALLLPMSLAEYFQVGRQQAGAMGMTIGSPVPAYLGRHVGIQTVSTSMATVPFTRKTQVTFIIKDQRAYVLLYDARSEYFDHYLSLVTQIAGSITVD